MPTATEIAVDFLNIAFNEHDPVRAFRTHAGDPYVQHNPYAPDGAERSAAFLEQYVRSAPDLSLVVHRTVADGELVAVHAEIRSGGASTAVVDILRVVDGKIVEHWDVAQGVPDDRTNDNTMF